MRLGATRVSSVSPIRPLGVAWLLLLAACSEGPQLAAIVAAESSGHPQTVWDQATLSALQNAANSTNGSYPLLVSNLRQILDCYDGITCGIRPIDRDHVYGYAMATKLLGRNPSRAVNALRDYCNAWWATDLDQPQALDLINGAIAYDVLYLDSDEQTRQRCLSRVAESAQAMATAVESRDPRAWWADDPTNGHYWLNFSAIGIAGQALEAEHGPAWGWQSMTNNAFQTAKTVLDLVADGSWHEGMGYEVFLLGNGMLYHFGAARRVGPNYELDKTELLRNFGNYVLSTEEPNHPHISMMTHADWGWLGPGVVTRLRWAAGRMRDPYAAEAARRYDEQPRLPWAQFLSVYAQEFIAYDPTVLPADMSTAPLDRYNADQQSVILRDSWRAGRQGPASETIIVGFKAGVLGGRALHDAVRTCGSVPTLNYGHDHIDDLSLWIYGKGGWQLPEHVAYKLHGGGLDRSQNFDSTLWHNSILFDQTVGQLGDDKSDSGEGLYCGTSGPPWFWSREASMPLHVSTDHYAFARADGKNLYPSWLNLDSLFRTIGFSREVGVIALQDQATSATPHTMHQTFHSLNPDGTRSEPDQGWLRLDNHTDADFWQEDTPASDTVLGIRLLAPASAVSSSPAPLTYACGGGDYCARDRNGQVSQYQYWRPINSRPFFGYVQVSSGAPQTRHVFLELLWPTTSAGWAERLDVIRLDDSNPEAGFVVFMAGGASEWWIYNTTGAPPAANGMALPGSANGSIGVARYDGAGNVRRMVVQGQGALADRYGSRTLLDLAGNSGVLEVAVDGSAAVVSGTAWTGGVSFWGPGVTRVELSQDGTRTPLPFTVDGSMITIGGTARPGSTTEPDSMVAATIDALKRATFWRSSINGPRRACEWVAETACLDP